MLNGRKIAAFAAIYILWGSTYLAIRYAIETIPPFLMMGARSVAAGLVLYLWSRREHTRITRPQWKSLILIAILFFVLGHGLLAWAQTRVASGLAAVLIASDPLWIAVIESLTIKKFRLSRKQILGLVIGFGGIILMFIPAVDSSQVKLLDTTGAAVILVSAICWSIGAVYSRVAAMPKAATLAAGIELIVGGLLLIAIAFAAGELTNFAIDEISTRSILAFVYLVVFGSVITFTAYVWLLQTTSATVVATHTYVNPVIALVLGTLVAGEQFTSTMLIASAVIVVSVYLVLETKSQATGELRRHPERSG